MLYREVGYCCARGISPSKISSQNLVVKPFPTLNEPLVKKSLVLPSLDLSRIEFVGLAST
jgi:hypothetical protein